MDTALCYVLLVTYTAEHLEFLKHLKNKKNI